MGFLERREMLLSLADLLWSALIVAPLVVLFWRGTWDILDVVVYPSDDLPETQSSRQLSGMVCYLIGLLTRIFLDLIKFHLKEFLDTKPLLIQTLGGLVFRGAYAFSGVSFWRGIWNLMIQDVGLKTFQLIIVLVGSLLVLLFSRVSRSLISAPLGILLDNHSNTFESSTFFKRTPDTKWWFLLDVVFTNLVARQLVVFSWWSLWSLENIHLVKNRIGEKDSYVSYDSILMGYAATGLVFTMDKLLISSTTTKQYITKPLRYLTTILAFFASVNVWRGVWSIYDNFLFPGVAKELNYLVSMSFGFLMLSLLLLSNTICNDMILADVDDAELVDIKYWKRKKSEENGDEMIPIIE